MNSKKRSGFTLIELLIVIMIIGLLSAIVLGTSNLARGKARQSRAIADLQYLANILEDYRMDYSSYPGDDEDSSLADLTVSVFDLDSDDTMLKKLQTLKCYDSDTTSFIDPWDNTYKYQLNSRFSYELISCGPDETQDTDDDISTTDI
jgi:general secretion pathway protein G